MPPQASEQLDAPRRQHFPTSAPRGAASAAHVLQLCGPASPDGGCATHLARPTTEWRPFDITAQEHGGRVCVVQAKLLPSPSGDVTVPHRLMLPRHDRAGSLVLTYLHVSAAIRAEASLQREERGR